MPTSISFPVERPVTAWEKDDIAQAIKNIMANRSFFYSADDDLGDEIRLFLLDHPLESNLEFTPSEEPAD